MPDELQVVMATRGPLLLHPLRPTLAPLFELLSRHRVPVNFNRRAVAVKTGFEHAGHRPGATLQRLLQHPLERPLRKVSKLVKAGS